jgi:hypothetical protein
MFTFAQIFFDAEQISSETGNRFYTEAGFFLLEQDFDFSTDVFHFLLWDFSYCIFLSGFKIRGLGADTGAD